MRLLDDQTKSIVYDSAVQRMLLRLIQYVMKLLKVFACGSIGTLIMYRSGLHLFRSLLRGGGGPNTDVQQQEKEHLQRPKPELTPMGRCLLCGGCFAIGLWIFSHPWLSSMYELNQSSIFYVHK